MKIWMCDLSYEQQVIAADVMPINVGYVSSYLRNATHLPSVVGTLRRAPF